MVDLRAAEEAKRGGLPRHRQAKVAGDDHRSFDGDVVLRRLRRASVPAERHLHRTDQATTGAGSSRLLLGSWLSIVLLGPFVIPVANKDSSPAVIYIPVV